MKTKVEIETMLATQKQYLKELPLEASDAAHELILGRIEALEWLLTPEKGTVSDVGRKSD